jgi:hypothetical protein
MNKLTLDQLIEAVREHLYTFAQSDAYDSGVRLSETEAYFCALQDAKRALRNEPKTN